MRSLRQAISRRFCLLLFGAALAVSGLAAQRAGADNEVAIIPLQSSATSLIDPSEANPFGLYLTGQATLTAGTKVAFRADLLPLARGGQALLGSLAGTNGIGLTVNGVGQVGGAIADVGAIWYFDTPTTVLPPFTLVPIANSFSTIVRYTDDDRILVHVNEAGFLPDSYVGRFQAASGGLNLIAAPRDNTSGVVFWDLAGSSVVGGIYSNPPGSITPYRANIVNGALSTLQTSLPTGFPQGSNGRLFFTDESGNGLGQWQKVVDKVGGPYEAGLVLSNGSSVALGVPAGFDYAYGVGVFGDMVVANAGKNTGTDPEQTVVRKLADGSPWAPLTSLAPANSGWTEMSVSTVSYLSIVGNGLLNGTKTGFIILPASVGGANGGTLTPSADSVTGGGTIQETFTFTNDSTSPRQAAMLTLNDPTIAKFSVVPEGSVLLDNGKTALIPVTAGQTQVVVTLATPATVTADRPLRLTGSTSATATPFFPASFTVAELTVKKP
jgi:hypothetical protein